MAIYTGVADANGDFNIPFSANYTGGQKVTVTAEKDAATKSIELYAPSEVISSSSAVQISGDLSNFPNGIMSCTINLIGSIGDRAFESAGSSSLFAKIKSLTLSDGVTFIGLASFAGWVGVLSLELPATLQTIANYGFNNLSSCDEIRCLATTPPLIYSTSFGSLKSTCIFKVPAGSVAAYQAAPNWSDFAARIQAI